MSAYQFTATRAGRVKKKEDSSFLKELSSNIEKETFLILPKLKKASCSLSASHSSQGE
jgi:hypothetical protein